MVKMAVDYLWDQIVYTLLKLVLGLHFGSKKTYKISIVFEDLL